MNLSIFGFQALWSPYIMLFSLVAIYVYIYLTRVHYKVVKNAEKGTVKQLVAFISAVVLFYIVKGSPVDLLSHIMFSVHMTQMALLLMLVSPLLIVGIPTWIWEKILAVPFIRGVMNVLTKPLIALILFSAIFSIYHLPLFFDLVKQNDVLHLAMTFVLFITSFFMWWPLFNNVPGEKRISGLKQVGYIIGSAILITPACALIIFNENPMYATYSSSDVWLKVMELCVPNDKLATLSLSGPELFTNMSLVDDQQLGGILMKVIQEVIYGVFLSIIFFRWFRSEQENADEITRIALAERQMFNSQANN